MLNRHFLRAKVLQWLYAFELNGSTNKEIHKQKLLDSISLISDLQIYLIAAFLELHNMAEKIMEENKNKYLPSEEDRNPNLKFINNAFFKLILEDKTIQKKMDKLKISFSEEDAIFRNIFKGITKSTAYINYMKTSKDDFLLDKSLSLNIFRKWICGNKDIYELIREKHLSWTIDYSTIAVQVLKFFRLVTPESNFEDIDKDLIDTNYVVTLFSNTIDNDEEYNSLINKRSKNWDMDRVATMDMIIIKMGITELLFCPTIPVNVTLNEYVELSKEYSTSKSKLFVNGLLDKITIDLRSKGKINKDENIEEEFYKDEDENNQAINYMLNEEK
ncbi:MAG: transcription antitermination factor NusB [Bacteroidales bacterium]|jgi:N utilization substance protein B|nr:transcription antitermination factor NusB [Bacteroidales bacterium]